MINLDILTNALPVSDWIETATDWMIVTFSSFFAIVQNIGNAIMDGTTDTFLMIPPLLFIAIVTLLAFFIYNKKWQLPALTLLGLLFIYNQGLWEDMMNTLTLVIVSSLVSIIIGIPLGI